jgi:hypothetical protein
MLSFVLPNVLQDMPAAVLQSLRQLGRMLTSWTATAMERTPLELAQPKLSLAKIFINQINRYTTLNTLASAASSILRNTDITKQLSRTWNMIDFASVREQGSWVVDCDPLDVTRVCTY